MSFTSEIKHEITQAQIDLAQSKAQLCALFLIRASISLSNNKMSITFLSENATIAKHVYKLVKTAYGIDSRLAVIKRMRLKKNNAYQVQIQENVSEILEDLGILTASGFSQTPPYKLVRSEKNCRAFLAGAFLASGSVNHPKTPNYHLEMSTEHEKLSQALIKYLERFYIPAKCTERKGLYVVYVKAGDKIADFLRLVNANEALFAFEDIRIQRDIYNQITRLDNCELANEVKAISAGKEHLKAIEILEKHESEIAIPEKIKRTMEIRKAYPDASIRELCSEMLIAYGDPITKSGMKHRLSKIKEMAEPFMEKEEKKE